MDVQEIGINRAYENQLTGKVQISKKEKALSLFLKVITFGIWSCVAERNCRIAFFKDDLARVRVWLKRGANADSLDLGLAKLSNLERVSPETIVFMANNGISVVFTRRLWEGFGKGDRLYGRNEAGYFVYRYQMRVVDAVFHVAVEKRSEKLFSAITGGMNSRLAFLLWNRNVEKATSSSQPQQKRLESVARCEFMISKGFQHPNPQINLQERIKSMKESIQTELTIR